MWEGAGQGDRGTALTCPAPPFSAPECIRAARLASLDQSRPPIKDEKSIYVNRHPFMHGVSSAVTMLPSVKSEMMPPSIEMAYHHNLIQLHAVTLL